MWMIWTEQSMTTTPSRPDFSRPQDQQMLMKMLEQQQQHSSTEGDSMGSLQSMAQKALDKAGRSSFDECSKSL